MLSLLIATRNAHKVREIREILGGQFHYLSLDDLPGSPEVIESASTFAGNAARKTREIVRWFPSSAPGAASHRPPTHVLADDSGLEVDALHGAPGVHSARFAALDTGTAGNSPTTANNAKLLRLLQDVPPEKRTARFRCVVAFAPLARLADSEEAVPSGGREGIHVELFEGVCEGHIILAPRGPGGFGYDPLFVPVGYEQTFAELEADTKNHLSHRALALAKLKERLGALA